MELLVEQLIRAVALAGVYLLVGLGVTLIFGLTRIVFFLQGELVAIGAFLTLTVVSAHVPIVIGLILAAVLIGGFAEILDLAIYRPTLPRPHNGLIISLGLITVIEAALSIRFTSDYYLIPTLFAGQFVIAGVVVNKEIVAIAVVAIAIAAGLFVFLDRTQYGRAMRALAENRTSAQVVGVPVGILISVVFIGACAIAGFSGGLLGTVFPFTSLYGQEFLQIAFAVAIVGGMGNVRGAALAALLLAGAQTLGSAYISITWSTSFLLLTMIVIILFRPNGILARGGSAADPLAGSHFTNEVPIARIPVGTRVGRVLNAGPRIGVVALIALAVFIPALAPTNRFLTVATFALINTLAAYCVWFGYRFAGIFSVAQMGFIGAGAYASVLVSNDLGFGFWLQLAAAVVASVFLAGIFGLIAFRTSGSFFVIILFALTGLQEQVLLNWTSLAGGSEGVLQASPAAPLGNLVDFTNGTNFYYLVLVFGAAIVASLYLLSRSGFGKLLMSLRDNDVLASSLGLNVYYYRILALVVSGAFGGVIGVLVMYADVAVNPTYFDSQSSVYLLLSVIMGGTSTLVGPAVGASIQTFLPDLFNDNAYVGQLVYGAAFVAIIMVAPSGIVGTLRRFYAAGAARISTRLEEGRAGLSEAEVPVDRARGLGETEESVTRRTS